MGSGTVDFAGCGPVHMVGGLAGAIACKIIGPRMGRFDAETGTALPIPGHSSPLATLGVFILWIGWFGFNPGSVVNLSSGAGPVAARAAVTTVLASASAALSALFFSHFLTQEREYDLGMALNGALAGLVSITGPCAFVEMWAAVCIGIIGGLVYVGTSRFTLHTLKLDDPLDATPVHFFCGMWGIIAGSFFANPELLRFAFLTPTQGTLQIPSGVFYGGNTYVTLFADGTETPGGDIRGALVANAVVEIVCICTWVSVCVTPLFLLLNHLGILRVPSDTEFVGLDVSHHGGEAYPDLFHAWNFQDDRAGRKPATAEQDSSAIPVENQPKKSFAMETDIEKQEDPASEPTVVQMTTT